jgi:dTDP-4-dehydrorhamnose 3,5-epimerase
MIFTELSLGEAWLIELEKNSDERGFFARGRCARDFEEKGLPSNFVQTNLSHNVLSGTFRGLHYQAPPSCEGKLVRCVRGAIVDIVVDLRPGSPTFLQHEMVRLDSESMGAVFVPSGFAHGFLTTSDDCLLVYEMTDYYQPECGKGIRWCDPMLEIVLPGEVLHIHPRDASYPDIEPDQFCCFESP